LGIAMVPLRIFFAGYPRERISSGSGVPLKLFFVGYPRECVFRSKLTTDSAPN
jgi:hypothetical protein